jgi:hypothetical protein
VCLVSYALKGKIMRKESSWKFWGPVILLVILLVGAAGYVFYLYLDRMQTSNFELLEVEKAKTTSAENRATTAEAALAVAKAALADAEQAKAEAAALRKQAADVEVAKAEATAAQANEAEAKATLALVNAELAAAEDALNQVNEFGYNQAKLLVATNTENRTTKDALAAALARAEGAETGLAACTAKLAALTPKFTFGNLQPSGKALEWHIYEETIFYPVKPPKKVIKKPKKEKCQKCTSSISTITVPGEVYDPRRHKKQP